MVVLAWKSSTEPSLLQMNEVTGLEDAVWAAAEGHASADQLTLIEADPRASSMLVERLIDESEEQLESVQQLRGPERDQVVADFKGLLAGLEAIYDRLNPRPITTDAAGGDEVSECESER